MLVDEVFDIGVAAGQAELIKQGVEVVGRGIHIALPYVVKISVAGLTQADICPPTVCSMVRL